MMRYSSLRRDSRSILDLDDILTHLTEHLSHTFRFLFLSLCATQDVEVLITAVFELGEVQSVALQETGCGLLAALVLPLVRAEIPNRHHQIVALAILELYLRCYKVPLQHQGEFPRVLSTFIGTQGIRHPAEVEHHTRSRSRDVRHEYMEICGIPHRRCRFCRAMERDTTQKKN